MAVARDKFLQDVRDYVDAGEQLIEGLTAFNDMNAAALEDLEGGMTLTDSFARRDSAGWSRRISALLDNYETCRRKTRESAALALLDEGQSVKSVAAAFGTTRQWAERLVKGARTTEAGDEPRRSGSRENPSTG